MLKCGVTYLTIKNVTKCKSCGERKTIAKVLGYCRSCIREGNKEILEEAIRAHCSARRMYALPEERPKKGIPCGECANNCIIDEGQRGYCNLVENLKGRLFKVSDEDKGFLDYYLDPLPTNCVAEWFCPGCTGKGFPTYAHSETAEYGYQNLSVFLKSCSLDCFFCQNWHFRGARPFKDEKVSSMELCSKVTGSVSCVCWFGGDPSTQMPFALTASEAMSQESKNRGKIFRVCWETNGLMRGDYATEAAQLSLETGGNIKFDLKVSKDELAIALLGRSQKQSFNLFKMLYNRFGRRKDVESFTASTLLIPGYIENEEVREISEFLSSIDNTIPYSLLAFAPNFLMHDLPTTSTRHAKGCYEVAKGCGLKNVHIGNRILLC